MTLKAALGVFIMFNSSTLFQDIPLHSYEVYVGETITLSQHTVWQSFY